MTGMFAGRSKEACYKKFLEANAEIVLALASLGRSNDFPSDEVMKHLERFVCILYGSSKIRSIQELRWLLYSHKQAEGENLPPTLGAFIEHIKRAHYMALIWNRNLCSFQRLPSPEGYGWKYDEQTRMYEPIMTQIPPAPIAVIDLVKCNCEKGCKGRCSCYKNELPCTEVCGCIDYVCDNTLNAKPGSSDVSVQETE